VDAAVSVAVGNVDVAVRVEQSVSRVMEGGTGVGDFAVVLGVAVSDGWFRLPIVKRSLWSGENFIATCGCRSTR
jgi:hypothetical protein